MQAFKSNIVSILLFLIALSVGAQNSEIKNFSLKKGEILDLLLITIKPNKDDALKDYFKTVSPVAKEYTFKPLYSSKIEKQTLGGVQPEIFYMARWNNLDMRLQFLNDITSRVPDFHERRRHIWSYFLLTYWQLDKDISLIINESKYHVATLFWDKDSKDYETKWQALAKKHNVKQLLTLSDAKSIVQYYNKPDYFVLSEFENEASFKKFQAEANTLSLESLKNIQQFVLK